VRPARITRTGVRWHEWLVIAHGSVEREASIRIADRYLDDHDALEPCCGRRASARLIDSTADLADLAPRRNRLRRRNTPNRRMRLRATRTVNFWYGVHEMRAHSSLLPHFTVAGRARCSIGRALSIESAWTHHHARRLAVLRRRAVLAAVLIVMAGPAPGLAAVAVAHRKRPGSGASVGAHRRG
jgi:hypothetical protein